MLRGLRAWVTDPRAMLLGLIPGVAASAVLVVAVVALVSHAGGIGDGIGHGLGGDGWWGDVLAIAAAVAIAAAGGVVAILLFATLTLTIGQPFFEAISRRIDAREGGIDAVETDEHWTRGLLRGLGEGLVTLAISLGVSVALFGVGLIPVAGSATAFVLGAVLGGRLLAIELTAYPFARRGIVSRRDRVRALRPFRIRTIAFGAAVFLIFLVPLGAVLAVPGAIAGATLLVRGVSAQPSLEAQRHQA